MSKEPFHQKSKNVVDTSQRFEIVKNSASLTIASGKERGFFSLKNYNATICDVYLKQSSDGVDSFVNTLSPTVVQNKTVKAYIGK